MAEERQHVGTLEVQIFQWSTPVIIVERIERVIDGDTGLETGEVFTFDGVTVTADGARRLARRLVEAAKLIDGADPGWISGTMGGEQ